MWNHDSVENCLGVQILEEFCEVQTHETERVNSFMLDASANFTSYIDSFVGKKTSKEIRKKYREKIKKDPVNLLFFKVKERETCRIYREKLKANGSFSEKKKEQYERYIEKLRADPIRYEKYLTSKRKKNVKQT